MENQNTPPPLKEKIKPSVTLLVITTCLVLLNVFLGFAKGMLQAHNVSFAIGSGISSIIFPIIVALLFSIAKSFRNARSRTKVVLWTSVVVLLATLANIGQYATSP
jgi:hypothetical protein